MVKEKRILIYFISFLLGLFTFLCINIIKVKADTVIAPVQYVTSDTTLYISNNKGADIQLNSSTQNSNNIDIKKIIMSINYNFKGNVIYQIELSTPTQYLINVNNVSILSNDNTCSFKGITDANVGFPKIRFTCPYDTSYVTISLSNLSDNNITSSYNFRWNYTYLSIVNENVVDLNPVLDGQGQIKDEITDSTNTITGEINDMQQSIIDSNKETQDVIKDQFNSCRDSYNLAKPLFEGNYVTDYIQVVEGQDYIYSESGIGTSCYYYFYETIGGTYTYTFVDTNQSWTATKNGYIRIVKSTSTKKDIMVQKGNIITRYEPYGKEICQNKIDDTNDKLNGIQGALTDTSTPNLEILGDTAGWLPAGPLDSVLNLPLTMMNNLLTNLGRTCSTFRVELPFVNKNIEIPCVENLMEQMGALVLWHWVGRIASVIILYSYLMNLYAWADKILTLRAELDEAMGVDLANWGRL